MISPKSNGVTNNYENSSILVPKKIKEPELLTYYQDHPNAVSFDGLKLLETDIVTEQLNICRNKQMVINLQNARNHPEQNIRVKLQHWFEDDSICKLILEDFPAFLPLDTDHWVLWINPKIQDSNQAQEITDQYLNNFIDSNNQKIEPKDYIIWHHKERNGSVPMAIHYHIFIRTGLLNK